jgi:hypothetical protein
VSIRGPQGAAGELTTAELNDAVSDGVIQAWNIMLPVSSNTSRSVTAPGASAAGVRSVSDAAGAR